MEAKLEAILKVVEEVIEVQHRQIGTHYEECWLNHVGCFAAYVKMIAEREEN